MDGMLPIVLGVGLTLFVVWQIARSHFISGDQLDHDPENYGAEQTRTLNDQRARCLQVLRELELDFATGKVSGEDYNQMRAGLGRELVQLVSQLKGLQNN